MELSLPANEAELVLRVLTEYLPNLREEIGKTENFDMRQNMKVDEQTLKTVIARLKQAGVAAS